MYRTPRRPSYFSAGDAPTIAIAQKFPFPANRAAEEHPVYLSAFISGSIPSAETVLRDSPEIERDRTTAREERGIAAFAFARVRRS
jgi:hypothetical protein